MLSSVEAWWAGLYALPFDGAQGDSPFNIIYSSFLLIDYYSEKLLFGLIEPIFTFAKAGYQHSGNRIASSV